MIDALLLAALAATLQPAGQTATERALSRCATVENEAERLGCYDRLASFVNDLAAEMPARAAAAPQPQAAPQAQAAPQTRMAAPASTPAPRAMTEDEKVRRFGLSRPDPDEVISEISGRVVGLSRSPYGKAVVSLDNGQVWRQLDSDSTRIALSDEDVAGGISATVKKGFLSSHFVTLDPPGRSFKAKRVK